MLLQTQRLAKPAQYRAGTALKNSTDAGARYWVRLWRWLALLGCLLFGLAVAAKRGPKASRR